MAPNATSEHRARVAAELARVMGIPRTHQNDSEWVAKVCGLRVEMVRCGAWDKSRINASELAQLEKMESEEDGE